MSHTFRDFVEYHVHHEHEPHREHACTCVQMSADRETADRACAYCAGRGLMRAVELRCTDCKGAGQHYLYRGVRMRVEPSRMVEYLRAKSFPGGTVEMMSCPTCEGNGSMWPGDLYYYEDEIAYPFAAVGVVDGANGPIVSGLVDIPDQPLEFAIVRRSRTELPMAEIGLDRHVSAFKAVEGMCVSCGEEPHHGHHHDPRCRRHVKAPEQPVPADEIADAEPPLLDDAFDTSDGDPSPDVELVEEDTKGWHEGEAATPAVDAPTDPAMDKDPESE